MTNSGLFSPRTRALRHPQSVDPQDHFPRDELWFALGHTGADSSRQCASRTTQPVP